MQVRSKASMETGSAGVVHETSIVALQPFNLAASLVMIPTRAPTGTASNATVRVTVPGDLRLDVDGSESPFCTFDLARVPATRHTDGYFECAVPPRQ